MGSTFNWPAAETGASISRPSSEASRSRSPSRSVSARVGVVTRAGASHRRRLPRRYVSFAFTERLVEVGVDPSAGSVGDAYDDALAESQIGLYKTELTRPEGPWRGVEHVDLETLNWVDWFNTERPHEALSDLTPMAAEELHYAAKNELMPTG